MESDTPPVEFDGFPGFMLYNERGLRHLYNEDGDELATFPKDRTDKEVWQWLVGWRAGIRTGIRQGQDEARHAMRRALGID